MLSLAELTRQRDALLEARASGVLEFRDSNGERVVYRSVAELNSAVSGIESEIARMLGSPQAKAIYFKTSKGV